MTRSPPGTWRLFAPALLAWAITSAAITRPGAAGWLGLAAALFGSALIGAAILPRRAASQHERDAAREDETRRERAQSEASRLRRAGLSRHAVAILAIACASLALIGARVTVAEQARADHTFLQAAETGAVLDFMVRLAGYPEYRETSFGERGWVRAEAVSPSGDARSHGVPMLLWLDSNSGSARAETGSWAPGMLLEVRGRLKAQAPADSAAYTVALLSAHAPASQPLSARLGEHAAALRHALVASASAVPGAELVPGFAVGDTSLVTEELDEAMLASSLSHLVAVSGTAMALVMGASSWCPEQAVCAALGNVSRAGLCAAHGAARRRRRGNFQ